MAAVKMRHFVLVEPFRKADVSIFDEASESRAIALFEKFRAEGKVARFITATGTVNDLKGVLADLKAQHQPHCGLCDRPIKAGHLCGSCRGAASRM